MLPAISSGASVSLHIRNAREEFAREPRKEFIATWQSVFLLDWSCVATGGRARAHQKNAKRGIPDPTHPSSGPTSRRA